MAPEQPLVLDRETILTMRGNATRDDEPWQLDKASFVVLCNMALAYLDLRPAGDLDADCPACGTPLKLEHAGTGADDPDTGRCAECDEVFPIIY